MTDIEADPTLDQSPGPLDLQAENKHDSGDDHDGSDRWTWTSWQVILILTNAVLGLIIFEYSWYKTRRWRKPIAEVDNLLPAYRRPDAAKWSKFAFYPGAVTMMVPRFAIGVTLGLTLCIILKIALLCQPMDQPIKGCRKCFIRVCYKVSTFLFQLITNFHFVRFKRLTMEDVNHYTEWLGPVEVQEREFLEPDPEQITMTLDLNASLRLSEKRGSDSGPRPSSKG